MDKIILGVVVGLHGRPNASGQKFKVSLYSFANPYLKDLKEFWLFSLDKKSWKKILAIDTLQASGAKWGQAREILIPVSNNEKLERGQEIAIDRLLVPPTQEGEYFVADLIGLEVFNEFDKKIGVIIGSQDLVSQALHRDVSEGVNLIVKAESGLEFAFPFSWISRESLKNCASGKKLIVESIEEWIGIEHKDSEDDRD